MGKGAEGDTEVSGGIVSDECAQVIGLPTIMTSDRKSDDKHNTCLKTPDSGGIHASPFYDTLTKFCGKINAARMQLLRERIEFLRRMLQPSHALGGCAQRDHHEHGIILVAAVLYDFGDNDRRMLAAHTDANLNEVARFETRSRLQPHVLPHPLAMRVNGLPIERLTDTNLPSHYSMVGDIHRTLMSWSPAIFVGFNSIRFDEEMLRHALFQSLYPAFLTSNHRNCRADALSLMMAVNAVSPEQLVVLIGEEGQRTFRLHHLAAANGVVHTHAHDAMSDVLATVELCRRVYQRSPELWQRFVRFSNKATVADFVEAEDGFVLTEFFGGRAYHAPVVCIGVDPEQANGRICLRLNQDVNQVAAMSDSELQTYLSQKPSPIRRFRVNASPTLTAFFDAPEHMLDGGLIDHIEDQARRVKTDAHLCARLLTAYVASREPYPLSPHLEERIYNGFPGPDDERRTRDFHQASWPDRLAIVKGLEDERLRWFGLRLLYSEARGVLSATIKAAIEHRLAEQLAGDGSGCLTYGIALAETEKLIEEGADHDGLLSHYRIYLQDRSARAAAFSAQKDH